MLCMVPEMWMKLRFKAALRQFRFKILKSSPRTAAMITVLLLHDEMLEHFMVRLHEMATERGYGDWLDELERLIQFLIEHQDEIMALIELIMTLFADTVPAAREALKIEATADDAVEQPVTAA